MNIKSISSMNRQITSKRNSTLELEEYLKKDEFGISKAMEDIRSLISSVREDRLSNRGYKLGKLKIRHIIEILFGKKTACYWVSGLNIELSKTAENRIKKYPELLFYKDLLEFADIVDPVPEYEYLFKR